MPKLVVENVGHQFGRRTLFRKLSFELGSGGFVGITGANGSGKSTLVRILAGILTPGAGTVSLSAGDKLIDAEERSLSVGLVAPYLNLYDGLTLRENLEFIARTRGLQHAGEAIRQTMTKVELVHRADDRFGTFSSGMRQRGRFAAALLANPPLLLLDEPTTNLDETGRSIVDRIVNEGRVEGRLLMLATNDASEIERADSVIRIEDYAPPTRAAHRPA